ncbi:HI0074 family nucleotidyltransferase substrate-binding subunit [Limnobacter sp.]|uniref:HI0074 family nucleotidyltransferase substrate-binding subunit n=1 Tax=Limnobacter sp. TaxID=2003368 RepID=UPI002FE0946D
MNSFIRDSVIQRFEFCWELAWKVLKLRLEQLGIAASNPRDVFKEALAAGLIHDGNRWSEAQRMRNLSSPIKGCWRTILPCLMTLL